MFNAHELQILRMRALRGLCDRLWTVSIRKKLLFSEYKRSMFHVFSVLNKVFIMFALVLNGQKQHTAVALFYAPGMLNLPLNAIHAECHIVSFASPLERRTRASDAVTDHPSAWSNWFTYG